MKIFTFVFITLFLLCSALSNSQEVVRFKNQKFSNTNWEEINPIEFLSLKKWKIDQDEKSKYADWDNVNRERTNKELIGHFFQCHGNCRMYRTDSFFRPQYKSNIYEGDDVQTMDDSYAWIFLLDGTMIRLSPNSSITFHELNIGIKENFINARVNTGNVLWLSRRDEELIENNFFETDALFKKLNMYEAQSIVVNPKYNEDNLFPLIEERKTNLNQYKKLNELVRENNQWLKSKPTFAFIVTPTITLMGYSPSVEIISLLGGQAFVKNRSASDLGLKDGKSFEINYQLRGFENKTLNKLEEGKWFVVNETGKEIKEDEDILLKSIGEITTKRIPSLQVARELFLKNYSHILFEEKYDRVRLALLYGYRLWGEIEKKENVKEQDDLYLRYEFLKEYTRRVETTNITVSQKFKQIVKARGEKIQSFEYGSHFFKSAIDAYIKYKEYTDVKIDEEELNSTKKYLWKKMHGIRE